MRRPTRSDRRAPDAALPRAGLVAALLLVVVTSCVATGRSGGDAPASPPPADAPPPGVTFASAAAAADSGEHGEAVRLLEEVRQRCGRSPAGGRASLLLAAVHLDPRFSEGSPQAAAEAMAEHLRSARGPGWAAPLARTLYLEALEKGASAPDPAGLAPEEPETEEWGAEEPGEDVPAGCGETAAVPELTPLRVLPSLPGTPMAERLQQLRDRVAELEQELERIRDVLDEP